MHLVGCGVIALLMVGATAQAQTNVTFASNDADLTGGAPTQLTGLLYRPPGDGAFPAIVLMHGCGGLYNRDGTLSSRHDDWARRYHGLGYVVLYVDSFSSRGIQEICTVKGRTI